MFKKLLVLVSFLGFVTPAFALYEVSTAAIKQDMRNSVVKVEGSLICKLAEVNNGQPCELKFQDREGKAFNLTNANNAIKMYYSGTTNVVIEGTIANSTIDVKSINGF